MKMICDLCGSEMKIKTKNSGEKNGLRYWVCLNWPNCSGKKSYAEMGTEHKWHLENKKFAFLPKK